LAREPFTAFAGWRCAQYDGIVAKAACADSGRGRGVNSMMVVLLIAGIGSLVAGLLAIGFGIPVKEFSFGNTLILTGAVTACTGMVMLGLWMVVRELKNIARRLGPGLAAELEAGTVRSSAGAGAEPGKEGGGFLFSRDQPASEDGLAEAAAPSSGSPPPWHEEVGSRDRVRNEAGSEPEPAEAAPAAKPRRNLLFSSSSKKERERAQARTGDPAAVEPGPVPAAAPPAEPGPPPPATFDDAWPKPERSRAPEAPQRRGGRAPSTFTEASAGAATADRPPPPAERIEEQPPVTVLKSGVVDGMAYSLYSDGSIEAQMPEGMMRFASIDELRSHLDHRP
jgi:hypothetical protein